MLRKFAQGIFRWYGHVKKIPCDISGWFRKIAQGPGGNLSYNRALPVADLGEPVTGRTAALHQRDRQEIIADEHRIVLAQLSARDRDKARLRCERYQYLRRQYVAVILAWHANEEALPFIATFVIHDLCTYVMNK